MENESQVFTAEIIDFNPKRMTPEEASLFGLPPQFADKRQYPLRIGIQLGESAQWYESNHSWFYQDTLADSEQYLRLLQKDSLILTGSGHSAHKYQENPELFSEQDKRSLDQACMAVRDFLGEGKWVFGTCFGGQLGAYAVGCTLGRLPENEYGNAVTEAGLLEHELTEAGRNDEVFGYLREQETVWAPHLHSDYVAELPKVGTVILTASGPISVVKAEPLLIRHGYADRFGIKDTAWPYIHAAVIEFSNGARYYHSQPHPEMATKDSYNFLSRQNKSWLAKEEEMGEAYYNKAISLPYQSNFSYAEILPRFIREARTFRERQTSTLFVDAVFNQELLRFLVAA